MSSGCVSGLTDGRRASTGTGQLWAAGLPGPSSGREDFVLSSSGDKARSVG